MKKLKGFFRLTRNRGFTMVELVISVVLLAILLGGMMIMVAPVLESFNDTKRDLVAENVSNCILENVSIRMRNATNVIVFGNTNIDSIKANANGIVNDLKNTCKDGYKIDCISLKYDATDGRYYLYDNEVDITKNIATSDPVESSSMAFSKAFYNDLYFDIEYKRALDNDKLTEDPQPTLKDTAEISITTYSDEAKKVPVYYGAGLTEFREIGRDIVRNEKNPANVKYKFNIYTGAACTPSEGFKTSDATDDTLRDVYIFYTSYKFAAAETT